MRDEAASNQVLLRAIREQGPRQSHRPVACKDVDGARPTCLPAVQSATVTGRWRSSSNAD